MTEITQCPQCGTRFKVTQAQRESHQGMVRCGRCQAVFNAAAHLVDDTSPQLSLPIDTPEPELATLDESAAVDGGAIPASTLDRIDFSHLDAAPSLIAPNRQQASRRLPWLAASGAALLVLALQAAYFFRIELVASIPASRHVLEGACGLLRCSIPLPQQADLVSIESSTLEADPNQPSIITLSALLRNHADYAMAYPALELTLTNFEDNAIARRLFQPGDYLNNKEAEKSGLAGNRETTVKLHLDTTDLKPAGYRLFLLYTH